MTLLVSLAFAQDDAAVGMPCPDPYVTDAVPAAGALDVPVDVQPAILWRDDCVLGGSIQLTLEQGDALVAEHRVDLNAGRESGILRLDAEELLPDTEYRLTARDSQDIETEWLFTTGSGRVQGTAAPEVTELTMQTWTSGDENVVYTSLYADIGDDPDGLSALVLLDADGEVLAADTDPEWVLLQAREVVAEEQPLEHCVYVVQEDGAGVRSEAVEACGEPELQDWDEEGWGSQRMCSAAPLSLSFVTGLLALVAVGRRS